MKRRSRFRKLVDDLAILLDWPENELDKLARGLLDLFAKGILNWRRL